MAQGAGDEGKRCECPYKIKALGIKVETTSSSSAVDCRTIEVRTIDSKGKEQSVRGTIIGKIRP